MDGYPNPTSDTLLSSTVYFIGLNIVLLLVCYLTGETPRWQWGERETKKEE